MSLNLNPITLELKVPKGISYRRARSTVAIVWLRKSIYSDLNIEKELITQNIKNFAVTLMFATYKRNQLRLPKDFRYSF